MNLLSAALFLLNLLVFFAASLVYFRKAEGPQPRLLYVLAVGTLIGGLGLCWLLATSPIENPVIGYALLTGSLALFLWTATSAKDHRLTRCFYDDLPEHFHQSGPYRHVRHPFYTAYLMTYAGAALMTMDPLALPVCLLMLALYIHAARLEEGKFAASAYAAEYHNYRATTGMFWISPAKVLRRRRLGEPEPAEV